MITKSPRRKPPLHEQCSRMSAIPDKRNDCFRVIARNTLDPSIQALLQQNPSRAKAVRAHLHRYSLGLRWLRMLKYGT